MRSIRPALVVFASTAVLSACAAATANGPAVEWQEEFGIAERQLVDTGQSRYFVLLPGFQTVLASGNARLSVTVLDETREFNGITTRVVEEREWKNDELYEISRNFFAIDPRTGDVFYFGEEVDFYKKGRVTGHAGAWRAYEGGNRPGMIMPGDPDVGMKYYQELAPGVAMDRAEVISVSERYETPAGTFTDCLRTQESSKIKKLLILSPKEHKTYAPGIGLVQDEKLKLVRYGYVDADDA
jgi:hypothetical protein